MDNQQYIQLYADTILSEGANSAILISYEQSKIYDLSSDVARLTREMSNTPVNTIKEKYGYLEPVLSHYFEFLIAKGLAFFTYNPTSFPPVSTNYHTPSLIENCIIEHGAWANKSKLTEVLKELSVLGASFTEYRFYDAESVESISEVLEQFEDTSVEGIDLIIKYNPEIKDSDVIELVTKYQRLASVYIHTAPENRLVQTEYPMANDMGEIIYTTQVISDHSCCGQVSKASFFIGTIQTYIHNKKNNSCLSYKISIDRNGSIKNCPSLPDEFGNVSQNSLTEVLKKGGVKKLWGINKDTIDICKDCKYRYICTDCRAFTKNGEKLGKPAKCGYNPYTDEWHVPDNKELLLDKYTPENVIS